MADIVTKTEGDALSRLIQLQAGRHEIRLNWTGKGVDDLVSLCNAHAVKARLAKHLWTGLRELMQRPELRELPEALQAQITSIVLKSQALTDLETESHAKRMASVALGEKPKGAI
jgi:hypothetical protein